MVDGASDLQSSGADTLPPSDREPRWYLVHCKPREDDRAVENLQRQGFECYRPMRSIERLRSGRKYITQEPLFPGYLFIHLDCVEDNWYPIRSTRGVHEIVRFNADPLPVRDGIIEGIRTRLANKPMKEPYLVPGARVRIVEGAFARLEAIFVASDGDERVVLLIDILHQEHRVKFPLGSVRKVG